MQNKLCSSSSSLDDNDDDSTAFTSTPYSSDFVSIDIHSDGSVATSYLENSSSRGGSSSQQDSRSHIISHSNGNGGGSHKSHKSSEQDSTNGWSRGSSKHSNNSNNQESNSHNRKQVSKSDGSSTKQNSISNRSDSPNDHERPRAVTTPQKSILAQYEEGLLSRSVADAGRWAYGAMLVEVWALNESGTQLYCPEGGSWINPGYANEGQDPTDQSCGDATLASVVADSDSGSGSAYQQSLLLRRLSDKTVLDYVPSSPVSPGEGLPGILWTEASAPEPRHRTGWFGGDHHATPRSHHHHHHNPHTISHQHPHHQLHTPQHQQQGQQQNNMYAIPMSFSVSSNFTHQSAASSLSAPAPAGKRKKLVWRDLKAIADDPHQPWNERLRVLADVGLGWVVGVPFSCDDGQSGIVVYMAREGVELDRLSSETNEHYLVAASKVIGSVLAFRRPWRQVVEERQSEHAAVLRRIRARIVAKLKETGLDLGKIVNSSASEETEAETIGGMNSIAEKASTMCTKAMQFSRQRIKATALKIPGAGGKPPPCMGWTECFLSFFGVLATLIAITRLNLSLQKTYGDDFAIVLGPFGALVTLLYGLSGAPAAQPRNAILGQIVSLTIAVCIGNFVPIKYMPLWLKQSVATALAVAAMAKLGITHPPAGAAAMIVVSNRSLSFTNAIMLVIGNMIALCMASFINNFSTKRQYPTAWGLPFIDTKVRKAKVAKAKRTTSK